MDFHDFPRHLSLSPIALRIVGLGGWLVLFMLVFIPLERIFAARRRKIARKGFWTDLAYYVLNGLLPKFLMALPLGLIAWFAHRYLPYRLHLAVESLPGWARMAASVIVLEIGFYWGHRWCHQVPFLWRFHAVHHSAEDVDWLVNTRAHPFDMVFTRLCGFVPLILLGLVQPGGTAAATPFVVTVIGVSWGFFIHANLRWRFGWLEYLVSTPAFHHWHHTNDRHRDMNFAPLFPVVDWAFGTLHMPRDGFPSVYGIDRPISPNMAAQLLDPILAPGRAAAAAR